MTDARSPNDTAAIGGGGSPEEIADRLLQDFLHDSAGEWSLEHEELQDAIATAIRDARARALEEAAKVADEERARAQKFGREAQFTASKRDAMISATTARDIASAIGSLKAQP